MRSLKTISLQNLLNKNLINPNSQLSNKKLSKSLQNNNLLQIIMQLLPLLSNNSNKNQQLKRGLNKNLLSLKLHSQKSLACQLKNVGRTGKEILKVRQLIKLLNKKNSKLKTTEKIGKKKQKVMLQLMAQMAIRAKV